MPSVHGRHSSRPGVTPRQVQGVRTNNHRGCPRPQAGGGGERVSPVSRSIPRRFVIAGTVKMECQVWQPADLAVAPTNRSSTHQALRQQVCTTVVGLHRLHLPCSLSPHPPMRPLPPNGSHAGRIGSCRSTQSGDFLYYRVRPASFSPRHDPCLTPARTRLKR